MNAPVEIAAMAGMFRKTYDQIETRFDPEHAVAWTYMKPVGSPCFNTGLLRDLRAHDSAFEASGGFVPHEDRLAQARYHVLASRTKGIYNLGGDLALFMRLIAARDRTALMDYAKLCIDDIHARICNYNSPVTTISLVQGDALGGGFETALSSNVVIAERGAKMGLPEILFNLFPGMGAYSLLGRRIGMQRAEEMIVSGRVYAAAELHEMGVIDLLAEDGRGEDAVRDYVRRNERRGNGMQAIFRCRQHFSPVSYAELIGITEIWVDAALRLEEKDLKLMSRLVRAQRRRTEGGGAERQEEARFGGEMCFAMA